MLDQLPIAAAAAIGGLVSGLVVFLLLRAHIARENDHTCDHLKICWNVLASYRRGMPETPQPMDQAMGHLQQALVELGADMPDGAPKPPGVPG